MSKEIFPVARIILQQMGGVNKIKAMTGATHFGADTNCVTFKFKGSRKANHVRITLNSMDLYDLVFFKITKLKFKEAGQYTGIYNDQLKDTFEQHTGLYLSL